jgi:hypothetical protein
LITPFNPKWCKIAASFNEWRKSMLSKPAQDRHNSRESTLESTFLSNRVPAILYRWWILEQTDAA